MCAWAEARALGCVLLGTVHVVAGYEMGTGLGDWLRHVDVRLKGKAK